MDDSEGNNEHRQDPRPHMGRCHGLAEMLTTADDIRIVGEGHTHERAVAVVAEARPHVVLLDLEMPHATTEETVQGLPALPQLSHRSNPEGSGERLDLLLRTFGEPRARRRNSARPAALTGGPVSRQNARRIHDRSRSSVDMPGASR